MSKVLKEIIFFIGCGLLLLGGLVKIKRSYSVFDRNVKSKYVIEQESIESSQNAVKQAKLNDSYIKVMSIANIHKDKQIGTAIRKYKDAKSIYPYRMEPRLALAKSYVTLSKKLPKYCVNAEQEIDYAWKYIPQIENHRFIETLLELESEVSKYCL